MRVRRLILVSAMVLSLSPVLAQHTPYEYYISGNSSQFIESAGSDDDLTLFYIPLEGGTDIFTDMSEFNFSAVRYARRGFDLPLERVYLGDAELTGRLTGRTDYTLLSALRRSRMPMATAGGNGFLENASGLADGAETFLPDPLQIAHGMRAAMTFSNNAAGVIFSRVVQPESWYSSAFNIVFRTGNDSRINNSGTIDLTASLLQKYQINDRHSITAGVLAAVKNKELRSSTTKEAFELTGDNYYNPSWGYKPGDDHETYSRTRRDRPILVYAGYEGKLSSNTQINTTVSYTGGESAYASLSWFDAETPYPDYYRYMPSYYGDTPVGDFLRDKWRAKDPSVIQIDWSRICEANRYNGQTPVESGGARYFIEDRVERSNDLQGVLSFRTRIDDRSDAVYGLRLRNDRVRYFKRIRDLLGGAPFINADQYLADTTRYGGKWLNDMRNPRRLVGEGDKFGYDYYLRMQKYELYALYNYTNRHFRLNAAAELGGATVMRKGNYEKQLHPGNESYGNSKKIEFDTYTAKLSMGYSFSPKHILRATGLAAQIAPDAASMFVSPQSANMIIDDPKTLSVMSGEAEYIMTLNGFMCKVAGFSTATSHESAVYAYYDDIESVYSDMVVTGISKIFYGLELGASYDFSSRLALSLAASIGKYEYTSDPSVKIYNDAMLTPYVEDSRTYLTGYRVGNTPELATSAELRYNVYGFTTSLTFNYMGRRYVAANPLRRMERAYMLTDSPESFREFVAQEKLPDAMTVDFFIMKTFDIKDNALTVFLAVDNLLNRKDIIYSGYEQMRIMRLGSGLNQHYVPFDSKYLYSYPRSVYLSASYRF